MGFNHVTVLLWSPYVWPNDACSLGLTAEVSELTITSAQRYKHKCTFSVDVSHGIFYPRLIPDKLPCSSFHSIGYVCLIQCFH